MAVLKCKMCGGTLRTTDSVNVCVCEYCGTAQTLPKVRDDINFNLFNRANDLRSGREFDKAQEIYEKIVQNCPDDSEAYWGLVLCKYGIEYVTDPKTGRRLPTCHRTQTDSVLMDMDYKSAVNYAEPARRNLYVIEAEEIDRIQRRILDIARSEEAFDVFICYKQTDEAGNRTPDSVIANDIYFQLKQAGIKAFYSAITLEDKLGSEYEPYIYSALSSARVMLVVGTKPEYFQSVWLRNEWSRFLKFVKNDRTRLLIPCYKDMDPYDLPEEFSHLQAQDMSKIGFINDIIYGIKKLIRKEPDKYSDFREKTVTAADEQTMIRRIELFFNSAGAEEYCDRVLDKNPECAKAYYYKFLAEHFCADLQELYSPNKVNGMADFYIKGYGYDVRDDVNYQKRVQYVLKHSIKNAIDLSRGAEHEEYVHAYEGMVSLIRNAIKAKEQQKIAEELRLQEEAREQRRIKEQQRIREIKRARNRQAIKTFAIFFLCVFLIVCIANEMPLSFFLMVILIAFFIIKFLK